MPMTSSSGNPGVGGAPPPIPPVAAIVSAPENMTATDPDSFFREHEVQQLLLQTNQTYTMINQLQLWFQSTVVSIPRLSEVKLTVFSLSSYCYCYVCFIQGGDLEVYWNDAVPFLRFHS